MGGPGRGPVRFKDAYKAARTPALSQARCGPSSQSAAMALRPEGLDELPAACLSPCGPPNPAELYSEARRLALEELVAGGPAAFEAFLRRERLGRFLNPDEVRAILRAAERPGQEGAAAAGAEDSFGSSHDCSSGTYFPEQSDLEPPLLELGWPAFYRGAYRGATRVEAHFQPRGVGAGGPYGCKDALRQQLRSAREVSGPPRAPGRTGGPQERETGPLGARARWPGGTPDAPHSLRAIPRVTETLGEASAPKDETCVRGPTPDTHIPWGREPEIFPVPHFSENQTRLLIFLAVSQHWIPSPKKCIPQRKIPERLHAATTMGHYESVIASHSSVSYVVESIYIPVAK